MTTLLSRLVRRRPRAGHLTFQVLTREGCCCCDKAIDLLGRYRRRHGFRLDVVDVDADADLAAAHGESVPVVLVDGKVRFRGVVNEVLLGRLLAAQSRGR